MSDGTLTPTECTLIWSVSSGPATKYILKKSGASDSIVVTGTSRKLTNLEPGTTYTYHVKGWNPAGESANATVTFTTPIIPPTLSGPSKICAGGTYTYKINNLPNGATTVWTKPSVFTTVSEDDTIAIYTYANPINAAGFPVSASVSIGGDAICSLSMISFVNKPTLGIISGPSYVGYLKKETYSVSLNNPCGESDIYIVWQLDGNVIGAQGQSVL